MRRKCVDAMMREMYCEYEHEEEEKDEGGRMKGGSGRGTKAQRDSGVRRKCVDAVMRICVNAGKRKETTNLH